MYVIHTGDDDDGDYDAGGDGDDGDGGAGTGDTDADDDADADESPVRFTCDDIPPLSENAGEALRSTDPRK